MFGVARVCFLWDSPSVWGMWKWVLSGGFRGHSHRGLMVHASFTTSFSFAIRTLFFPQISSKPNLTITKFSQTQRRSRRRRIMKMMMNTSGSSKRRSISSSPSRGFGGVLREQRAKLYIIRRCVVMLLCWHD